MVHVNNLCTFSKKYKQFLLNNILSIILQTTTTYSIISSAPRKIIPGDREGIDNDYNNQEA